MLIITRNTMKARSVDDWAALHNRTVNRFFINSFLTDGGYSFRESGILSIADGIRIYVNSVEGIENDYVLGAAVGRMLSNFIELLNGELGRLDAGTLDSWARMVAGKIGYDLDAGEMSA